MTSEPKTTEEGGASPSPRPEFPHVGMRLRRAVDNGHYMAHGWEGVVEAVGGDYVRFVSDPCPFATAPFPWAYKNFDVVPEESPPIYGEAEEDEHEAAMERALADLVEVTAEPDMVHMPDHYTRFKIEPIRFVVENLGPSFLQGNILKYIMRYDAKNGVEDLLKAERYTRMLRAYVEGDPDWWKSDKKVASDG